jgi:type IV pilus assembly protein PilW
MKPGFNPSLADPQRGMGLIELMIGMTIGLIVLMALGYFFIGSTQANRTHNDISRMQESGRHAMEILGAAVRQAGYRTDADVAFTGTALTGTNATPDTLTVQYDAQEGGEPDCSGANVAAGALVTYAFAVTADRELTCNGSVVADNIEDMQITYGIDSNKDGVIESYKAAPSVIEFGQTAAVNVALTVRGPTANAATGGDGFLRQTYTSTFTVRNQAR